MKRLAVLLLFVIAALGQQPETAAISGRVHDADGKPIAGVTIQISVAIGRGRGPVPPPHTTTAASDGTYSFTSIEPGQHTFNAIRAGYLPFAAEDGVHLNPGQQLTGKDLTLTPASFIAGKVTDENGDPVSGVMLQVWKQMQSSGGPARLVSVQLSATTNNSGQYKIQNVQPGEYSVSANGRTETQPDPQLFDIAGLRVYTPVNPIFNASPRPGHRPQAYLTTWYPQPVEIAEGHNASGIDIQLHKTPLYRVTGKVVNATGPAIFDVVNSAGRTLPWADVNNIGPDGTFEQNALTPGDYYFQIRGFTMATRGFLAIRKITITDKDIDDLAIQIGPSAEVHGDVTIDGKPPAQPLAISLTEADDPRGVYSGQPLKVESDGTFTIPRALPGPTRIIAAPPAAYVTSVTLNGNEVGDRPFGLPAGQVNLQIAYMAANGRIQVHVQPDSNWVMARFVLIVPEPGTRTAWRYQQMGAAGNGIFLANQLPPGDYRIYALGGVEQLTFAPEMLRASDDQSVKVTVTNNQAVETTVTTISR